MSKTNFVHKSLNFISLLTATFEERFYSLGDLNPKCLDYRIVYEPLSFSYFSGIYHNVITLVVTYYHFEAQVSVSGKTMSDNLFIPEVVIYKVSDRSESFLPINDHIFTFHNTSSKQLCMYVVSEMIKDFQNK